MISAKWQRIVLLTVLAYEGVGGVLGGVLLTAGPDGRYMDMPPDMMHGVFPDFLIPGIILTAMGILNLIAFVAVLRRMRNDWILAAMATVGFIIWFSVEIYILQAVHWLHIMWGVPVIVGALMVIPMVPSKLWISLRRASIQA